MYAQNESGVFVNLFINSTTSINVSGQPVEIIQENNYPWEGNLKFIISPKKSNLNFGLRIRIPGWAQNVAIPSDLYTFKTGSMAKATITINGSPFEYTIEKGYAVINRSWKKNDVVEVNLPMEVRRVIANKNAKEDAGKIIERR